MQGRHCKGGRGKRQKLGSDESAINDSATNDSAINDPANYDPVVDDSVFIEPTFCDSLQLEQRINADTYIMAHDDGIAMLDEYYRNSPIDSVCEDNINGIG